MIFLLFSSIHTTTHQNPLGPNELWQHERTEHIEYVPAHTAYGPYMTNPYRVEASNRKTYTYRYFYRGLDEKVYLVDMGKSGDCPVGCCCSMIARFFRATWRACTSCCSTTSTDEQVNGLALNPDLSERINDPEQRDDATFKAQRQDYGTIQTNKEFPFQLQHNDAHDIRFPTRNDAIFHYFMTDSTHRYQAPKIWLVGDPKTEENVCYFLNLRDIRYLGSICHTHNSLLSGRHDEKTSSECSCGLCKTARRRILQSNSLMPIIDKMKETHGFSPKDNKKFWIRPFDYAKFGLIEPTVLLTHEKCDLRETDQDSNLQKILRFFEDQF